jgi:hypothetical protein
LTSQPARNEGVFIGGNASVSGPVAGGRYARAQQFNHHADPARPDLTRLRELVDLHRAEIDEPDRVSRDIDEVERETAESRPDTDRIAATLRRIGGRVAGVAVVASAVAQLRDALLG